MNLKEAFRYQNKLQQWMDEAKRILGNNKNVTQVTLTHLRHKVMPEAKDEVVVEAAETEYADQINQMAGMLMFLLEEKRKLSYAICQTKRSMEIDFDSEAGLNSQRQELARLFKRMGEIRSEEVVLSNGGSGYRFNAEGIQVSYRCDLKRVTTINFDRHKIRGYASLLNQQADAMSAEMDRHLVNAEVAYQPPVDVNDTFSEVLAWYAQGKRG